MVKITLEIDGVETVLLGTPKEFKSGSRGFYVNGKAQGASGERYQVGGNVVLIGSKPKAA